MRRGQHTFRSDNEDRHACLLLAHLMGQYCFAGLRLSSSVTLPAGRLAVGRVGIGRPTLHGGPVRLRPVMATPCCITIDINRP